MTIICCPLCGLIVPSGQSNLETEYIQHKFNNNRSWTSRSLNAERSEYTTYSLNVQSTRSFDKDTETHEVNKQTQHTTGPNLSAGI